MATRKKQETQAPKTILIKPRDIFKQELLDRISIGEELYSRQIQTLEQLEQLDKEFSNWDDFNEELIKQAFNNQNIDFHYEYSHLNRMVGFHDFAKGIRTNTPAYKLKISKEKIDNCMTNLKRLVDKLPLIEQDSSISSFQTKEKIFYNRGFIVHGHNDTRKLEVARFIENDLRLKATILHEQPSKGRTIIEKFENYSNVDFAVAIWTADDDGKNKKEAELKDRARQNVIFETGFFIGKLGRQNVIVLHEVGVEIPSDYNGVIFIRLSDNWKNDLRKEIDAIYGINN